MQNLKKDLSVLWANQRWRISKRGRIEPTGDRIGKNNPRWIDYSKLPNGSTKNLHAPDHPESADRIRLVDQIIDDIVSENSDCVAERPTCFMTCGGTASGKTSAVDEFLKNSGNEGKFLRLDFDAIKKRIPEYPHMIDQRIREASEYCAGEAAKIGGKAFKRGYSLRCNLVYEKTNADPERLPKTIEEIGDLRRKGYQVFIIGTHLTEPEAQIRARVRFKRMGRYVAPEYIQMAYKNVPGNLITLSKLADGLVLFDNTTERIKLMYKSEGSQIEVVDSGLYTQYLSTVGLEFDLRNSVSI